MEAEADAVDLVPVGGADAAFRGADLLVAERDLAGGVEFLVERKHHVGAVGDEEFQEKCFARIADLKAHGLLDDTLVVWGGEFGRTPMSEKGDGRDHNPTGFTMWMAGGGVKGGQTIGSTDDLGLRAVENPLHVHDLHATILWLLGIDNMGLTYRYKGRPERPTQNEGEPYKQIVG